MKSFSTVRLGEVCKQDKVAIRTGERTDLRYVGMETIEANTGRFIDGALSKTPETPQANSYHFGPMHVLYGKLRPYLNKVAIPTFEGKCSTELVPLLPNERLDRRYLAYFLRSSKVVASISAKTAGARMPRADMTFVLGLTLPLPPLKDQQHIVDLLLRAESIVRLRREAQKKIADFVPALFIDMFGDPGTNPKEWPIVPLDTVSEVISGVAKGRDLRSSDSVELPYMRVANVKDGHLDLGEIKTILIKRTEVARLRIEPGDLLMTEGGDPDKLGRAALWRGEIDPCVHQNHIFKVRSNRARLSPGYLRSLVGSVYGKAYFLSVAKKTTGIASINKTQLCAFPVVLPPVADQLAFETRIAAVESIQAQQAAAIEHAKTTYNALVARAFGAPTEAALNPRENQAVVA